MPKLVTDGRVINSAPDTANCLNNYFMVVVANSLHNSAECDNSLFEQMSM